MAQKFKGIQAAKLNALLQSPNVRAALVARARRSLPRTRALALSVGAEQFARELHIETGTRPGTKADQGLRRPYARITATLTTEQRKRDGRTRMTRRQILRRGAFGG